jgi:HK97 family phage portal protein
MAQEPGHRISVGRKAVRWALQKAAGYAGVSLSLTNPKGWEPLFGNKSSSGKTVNDETAMQVSTVWACNRILASSVGALPLGVYERQSNGNAKKVDHPLAEILVDAPNEEMDTVEYREAKQVNLGLQGNGYSLMDRRSNGDVLRLYPMPSTQVIPQRNTAGAIEYKINDRGRWEIYPREKVWHLRGFGSNGLIGYSPIGMMRNAIGLNLAAEEFGAAIFERGAYPSLVVKIPQWLKEDQRVIARQNIRELWGGVLNAHQAQLLEGGMEIDKGGSIIPPADLQMLELRQFGVHEICRLYGVPPHMVAELTRATFSNIETMSTEYVMFCLLPWLRRWEASANRWLLKPADRKRFFVAFNFDGLLRADTAARAEYLRTMVANGLMSRNEGRAKENLNRADAPGMDDYTVQSNMISVDDLSKVAAAMTANGNAPKWAPQHLREGA